MTIGIGSEAALGVVHQGGIRAADRSNLAVRVFAMWRSLLVVTVVERGRAF